MWMSYLSLAATPHTRQRQLHPELREQRVPAAIACAPPSTAEAPRFAWNFFEQAQRATEYARFTGDVASAGETLRDTSHTQGNTSSLIFINYLRLISIFHATVVELGMKYSGTELLPGGLPNPHELFEHEIDGIFKPHFDEILPIQHTRGFTQSQMKMLRSIEEDTKHSHFILIIQCTHHTIHTVQVCQAEHHDRYLHLDRFLKHPLWGECTWYSLLKTQTRSSWVSDC